MEILFKKGNRKSKALNVMSINSTTIALSEATRDVYGLRNHNYFSIAKLKSGILVAVFSEERKDGFYKLKKLSKSSVNSVISKRDRRQLTRYVGDYNMKDAQPLMEDCLCYPLTPVQHCK
jgi:hypothetical protein